MLPPSYLLLLLACAGLSVASGRVEMSEARARAIEGIMNIPAISTVQPDSPNDTLQVNMNLHLLSIDNLDEKAGVLRVICGLALNWTDNRIGQELRLISRQYPSLGNLMLDSSLVWTPDIELTNPAASGMQRLNRKDQVIIDGSSVTWFPLVAVSVPCMPFGENKTNANCMMRFASWTQSAEELDIQINSEEVGLGDFVPFNPNWVLAGRPSQSRNVIVYCCPDTPWVFVHAIIRLQRRENG